MEKAFSTLNDTFAFPLTPSLVVTRITPFAPLDPYREVAVASFMIEKLAILSGSILAKSFVLTSKPSININGLFLYPKVVTPLMKNSALSWPGSPDLWYEITPASLPARLVVRFVVGCFNSEGFIVVIEPITLFFFCF